jgi:hypothetical protein
MKPTDADLLELYEDITGYLTSRLPDISCSVEMKVTFSNGKYLEIEGDYMSLRGTSGQTKVIPIVIKTAQAPEPPIR